MKSVLITGVGGGVGQACATVLLEKGWQVFGVDLQESETCNELSGFWEGDVALEAFWSETMVPAMRTHDLQGLVNNAAIQPCNSILKTSLEEWNRTLEVNLSAAFLATKHLSPLMRGGAGSIVNVSSIHAVATSVGMAAYVASKGGLQAFTRASALELAAHGIRVNAVLPGATETKMLEAGLQRGSLDASARRENLTKHTPLGRVAQPSEVAEMVLFLLDHNLSSFVTGASLAVDGGVLAKLSSE